MKKLLFLTLVFLLAACSAAPAGPTNPPTLPPTGERQTLLDVPRYDFNWQLVYDLSKPVKVPKGTHLVVTAHFDNSANNKFNPDPSATVYYGDMTWEEMMFGWFEMALADQDLTQPATAGALRLKEFLAAADSIRLDDQLQALARGALEGDKAFERFGWQLFDLVPQLDRICVTGVENGKLRLKFLHERLGLRSAPLADISNHFRHYIDELMAMR